MPNPIPHPTRNHLAKKTRAAVAELLADRLADTLDLHSQVKQAHWNVKGPSFIGLHELFDKIAEELAEHVDEIAERAVQLGGTALGTVRAAAKRSSLKEYPPDIFSGMDHVKALSGALAACGERIRKGIDEADGAGDKGTADLLTDVSRTIDKHVWMVEAHAQADR
jgi:starvation-inducible DNA-binding protein